MLVMIVNTKMFQDNSPQEIYGYCHLCYELKKFGVDYAADLKNWKRHVGSQCHPATEKPSDCDICGEKFRSMRDHDRHYCTKVPKTTEGWTTYKLLEKESVAARTISKLNPSIRQAFCFEQKLCIPGVYPGLTPPLWYREGYNFEEYGNPRGTELYTDTLRFRMKLRRPAVLRVDRKVQIWSKGEIIFRLDETVTRPADSLNVDDKKSSVTFELTLKGNPKKPKDLMPIDINLNKKSASVYMEYMKNVPYQPHCWPLCLTRMENLDLQVHKMSRTALRNSTGLRAEHFWNICHRIRDHGINKHTTMDLPAMVFLQVTFFVGTTICKIECVCQYQSFQFVCSGKRCARILTIGSSWMTSGWVTQQPGESFGRCRLSFSRLPIRS